MLDQFLLFDGQPFPLRHGCLGILRVQPLAVGAERLVQLVEPNLGLALAGNNELDSLSEAEFEEGGEVRGFWSLSSYCLLVNGTT